MPAKRSAARRDWPRGLYEIRPGYYGWRHPETHKTLILGRVTLAHAKNEAFAANRFVLAERPSLIAQLTGATNTVADALAKLPAQERENTARVYRTLDKAIREHMGPVACRDLTVKHCADLIEDYVDADKAQMATSIRSRLVVMCRKAMALGWMDRNVADATERPDVTVRRSRLDLETFLAIRAQAAQPWLPRAMNLALVTGQDVSTVAAMQRRHIEAERLVCLRQKTGRSVAIPLDLRLEVLGPSLRELVAERSGVLSPYLVHHVRPRATAKPGDPVQAETISEAFTAARRAAGIPDVDAAGKTAPTFHEIRSLAKRLYLAQGGVDTKALLNHASEAVAALYADDRTGIHPPIEVVVNAK